VDSGVGVVDHELDGLAGVDVEVGDAERVMQFSVRTGLTPGETVR